MKKYVYLISFFFCVTTSRGQDVIDPYINKTGETISNFLPSINYDGEYQISIDQLHWSRQTFQDLFISFKVETVSFPFVPDCITGNCAGPSAPATRNLITPPLAFSNQTNKWGSVFRAIENGIFSIQHTSQPLFLSSARYSANPPFSSDRSELPHTILKHTLYLHCGPNISDTKIDSLVFIYDNTRGRIQFYPFQATNNESGAIPTIYDLVFRPSIVFNTSGHPYNTNSNQSWYLNGSTSNGTINYFILNEVPQTCNGFGFLKPDPGAETDEFSTFAFAHPAPFTLLSAYLRDAPGETFAGYRINGQLLEELPGIKHSYKIQLPFDLTLINPFEKIIYNPSEVDINIGNTSTPQIFPSGYTFKTINALYPKKEDVQNADPDGLVSDPRKVHVSSLLTNTDDPATTNDERLSYYRIKSGSKLLIQPCVTIYDAVIILEAGGVLEYNPSETFGNFTIDNQGGTIITSTGTSSPACSQRCFDINFYDQKDITINTNTTWTSTILPNGGTGNVLKIAGVLKIIPGVTLTIDKDVILQFGPNAEVIVDRNGKLIVSGLAGQEVKFTTACAEQTWQGIEVWGDRTKSQLPLSNSPQGYLQLNNAIIENARNAVELKRQGFWGYEGGILQAANTKFLNCRRAAEFIAYNNIAPTNPNLSFNNLSFFTNCTFESTGVLPDNSFRTKDGRRIPSPTLVTMWQTRGIRFTNCTFKCNTAIDPDIRGIGIFTIDASYSVINSTFEGLTEGVSSISSIGGLYPINITGSQFNNNIRGIVFDAIQSSNIHTNTFRVPLSPKFNNANPVNAGVNKPLGVYLKDCSGFKVEENTFTFFGSPPAANELPEFYNYGIVSNNTVDNLGAATGNIYRNKFSNTIVGTQAELDNFGLDIKCNTYQNIATYDWTVAGIENTIFLGNLRDQGFCQGTDVTTPSGNQFIGACTAESQIRIFPSGVGFLYSSHTGIEPNTSCINGTVAIRNCGVPFDLSACPSNIISSCNPACNIANINNLENDIDNLHAQIDGNNTQALLDLVFTDAASGTVESNLLTAIPLSDTVMLAAFIHRTIPLPDNSVKNIAIANSPLTVLVLNALHNRTPALAPAVMQEIDNAQTGVSQRKQIEDQILHLQTVLGLTENELIRQYLENDSTGTDSVIAYLTTVNDEPSKKKLVQTHLLRGNCSSAQTVLNEITAVNSENSDFTAFYNIIINICQTRNSVFDITPAEEQTIRTIASHTTAISSNARNTLSLVFGDIIPRVPFNVQPLPGVLQPCSGTEVPNYNSNLTIGTGQTFYVAQGKTYTKDVTITNSTGTFCNNGTFTGKVIFQQGGTFNNVRTVNSTLAWSMSSGGTINNGLGASIQAASFSISGGIAVVNNYAPFTVTGSLSSSNPSFTFNNFASGILNAGSITSWSSGNLINEGTVTVTSNFSRSGGTFTNNGATSVSGNFTSSAGGFTNDSSLTVTGNCTSSGSAVNNCTISTSGDFTTSAAFTNNARISITKKFTNSGNPFTMGSGALVNCKDFTNSGGVINSIGGCGRFNISGTSINSATISSGIDICDATPPSQAPFIDINSGNISSSVTWCSCSAVGVCISGSNKKDVKEFIKSSQIIKHDSEIILYPNPTNGEFTVLINSEGETKIVIYDLIGKIIYSNTLNDKNKTSIAIDLKNHSKGIYYIHITKSNGYVFTNKIIYK